MKKNSITIAFVFFVLNSVQAQLAGNTLLTVSPVQYERAEWDIQLKANWNNPYLQEDISLDMHINSPSGKKLVLPCYYSAGSSGTVSNWKARFNPQEKGTYKYYFVLNKEGRGYDSSSSRSFTATGSRKDGVLHVKNNWVFVFDSGKPFRGVGENICWESRANDDSKFFKELHERPKYNYEEMLPLLAAHGGNYFRTWISSFNLPVDWQKGFNSNRYTASVEYFNPSAIAKMDRLVNLCDSLGLYMMLTLGQGAYHTRDGGHASSAADFFVNPASKSMYRNRLRYFVARWGYSPSIGAWEFFNEVDNVQFSNKNNPINPDDIVQWHDEMSTYLKELDPYGHVVTTSISHRDLKGLNSLKHIDINQKHIYKNTQAIPAEIERYEKEFNKPYVIGEYGYEWDWSKDFNLFADGMDSDFKRGLWYGLFSPTPVLPLSWWWEFFDDRKTDRYISKVRGISDRMLAAGKGSFEQVHITDSATGIKTFAVQCGKQVFIYLFNPSDSAKTARVKMLLPTAIGLKGRMYDPEKEEWRNGLRVRKAGKEVVLDRIELQGGRDLVLIVGR